ncbi:TPA: site-specific DNA-methyltransferase [Candidatus Gracilibacteria bacterium]|nr:site-specific DNA-methyltransferase [Candidatus Gracilibacteria bacterium]
MPKKIKKLQPEEFDQECTTVWSFPRRGNWATHNSKYRGNWSPDVVRNLIVRYSKEGDTLLDPMIGGGTTAIECKLLNRNLIAFDVNPASIELSESMLDFEYDSSAKIRIVQGDARELMKKVGDESVDFILHHPPYADIIKYSEGKIPEDLSNIHDIDEFADEMEKIARECFRVLKKGQYCAILIGDTRREKMYQPMAFKVMERFLRVGFALKEDIVKVQHNCKATGYWKTSSQKYNFLLIMHEHLFIFKKP